jgi:hypothetical protein
VGGVGVKVCVVGFVVFVCDIVVWYVACFFFVVLGVVVFLGWEADFWFDSVFVFVLYVVFCVLCRRCLWFVVGMCDGRRGMDVSVVGFVFGCVCVLVWVWFVFGFVLRWLFIFFC